MTTEEVQIKYPRLWEAFLEECRGPGSRGFAKRILDGYQPKESFGYSVNRDLLWDSTIYGRSLWSAINMNSYIKAKELYPELFIQGKPKVGTVIKNGFFKMKV